MNTRSTRRSGSREADYVGDKNKVDPLVRPAIRESKRANRDDFEGGNDGNKIKTVITDRIMSGLSDGTTMKTSLIDNVASKPSPSDGKQKRNVSKTSKLVSGDKRYRDDHNYDTHSGSDSDNEEENSKEEMPHTSAANFNMSSSRAADETIFSRIDSQKEDSRGKANFKSTATDDYSQGEGDMSRWSTLRSRKGEREEFVYKQQLRKANEKEQLLDKKKNKAFSDDEEIPPKTIKDRAANRPVGGTSLSEISNLWILILIFTILLLLGASSLVILMSKTSTHNAEEKQQVMAAFHDRFQKLPIIFPGQSQDLWQRSQRMLKLQLSRGNKNEEPAIILLTAARDAEKMLYCVGKQLAEIYASTLNSSYTVLSGLEMTSEVGDVKMAIDERLNKRFQANDKAAVLHRLELLPPASLLILYKYCDHENAAFKNVALVLTVLLKNSTLQKDIKLNELEEAVHEFFKETFINPVQSKTSHNEMDEDKLGGVWSRISHVVLPVFPEEQNVKECDELKASP